ncbi:MAG: methyltransferase domain-containing protein [Sphingomonadales bacterium]|nr:methyltransferase domain-containing protein [Sphingomonadales bacterium]
MAMDAANRRPTALALDLLAPQAGERVIDIGCGTGAATARLLARARCLVDCVDHAPAMLRRARMRHYPGPGDIRFHLAQLGELPFDAGSFDAALALNLLYFCDAQATMLADLRRVLRPGGRVVAYVTHRDSMEHWRFTRAGLHRLFDADRLRADFGNAGFAEEAIAVHECNVAPGVRGLFALARA